MYKLKITSFLFALFLLVACNDNSSSTNNITDDTSSDIATQPESGDESKSDKKTTPAISKPQKNKPKPYHLRIIDESRDVFVGEFAYMADAAYFINCSTDNKYSVVMADGFASVEKTYLKTVGDEAGSKVYAVFKGKIKNKKKGDKSKMKGYLTIKEVISMHKDVGCNTVTRRMGGMYTYMADAGIFIDCKTKRKYAVQTIGASAALESSYLKANEGGTAAYVELEGYVQKTKGMEEGTSVEGLFVTRIIGFDSSYSCE